MGALYKGVIVTAGISALVFIPVMNWMVDEHPGRRDHGAAGAGSTSARSSASSSRRC